MPPAVYSTGLTPGTVQGGFYCFGGPTLSFDEAHEMAHQRLAHLYFDAGLLSLAEQGCMSTLEARPGEVTAWINLGAGLPAQGPVQQGRGGPAPGADRPGRPHNGTSWRAASGSTTTWATATT